MTKNELTISDVRSRLWSIRNGYMNVYDGAANLKDFEKIIDNEINKSIRSIWESILGFEIVQGLSKRKKRVIGILGYPEKPENPRPRK